MYSLIIQINKNGNRYETVINDNFNDFATCLDIISQHEKDNEVTFVQIRLN